MEAFFIALIAVGIAEFGDKTQLLVLVMAARFRRPVSVAAGMVCAFLATHFLAAFGGAWLDRTVPESVLSWVVGLGFLAMAVWAARSRGHTEDEKPVEISARSAFLAAGVAFFVLEFGDKSQLATVGLAIALQPPWLVALGAAAGGSLINLPVIWLGHRIDPGVRFAWFRGAAAVLFAGFGLWILAREVLGWW